MEPDASTSANGWERLADEFSRLSALAPETRAAALDALAAYDAALTHRIGPRGRPGPLAHLPGWITRLASRAVFGSTWLTRRILIEDGFLHTRRPPMNRGGTARSV